MLCRAVMLCRCVKCAVPATANSGAGATAAAAATPNAAMSRFVLVLCVVFMTVFPFLCEQRHD